MSETHGSGQIPPGDGAEEPQEKRAPNRVIGTPPPARARTLLGAAGGPTARSSAGCPPSPPAQPSRPSMQNEWSRRCSCCRRSPASDSSPPTWGWRWARSSQVLRSNLALGVSMAVAFGALAVGAVIWVRYLMPQVDLTEERKPLASSPEYRAEFKKTFTRGPRPVGSSSGSWCGGP